MLKRLNLVGVIIGVLIIVFSILVFSYDAKTTLPDMDEITLEDISSPSYESDETYGGDAYTGIQQAAAQAANNLLPVFDAIEANNGAIKKLNRNNIRAANADANNAEAITSTLKYCVGFVLLSIGFAVIAKSVEFEISFNKKEEQIQETENYM